MKPTSYASPHLVRPNKRQKTQRNSPSDTYYLQKKKKNVRLFYCLCQAIHTPWTLVSSPIIITINPFRLASFFLYQFVINPASFPTEKRDLKLSLTVILAFPNLRLDFTSTFSLDPNVITRAQLRVLSISLFERTIFSKGSLWTQFKAGLACTLVCVRDFEN